MDKDKEHEKKTHKSKHDSKHLLRELLLGEERLHAPRKDLHEDANLHPHHKQADHVRHHHHSHILHHRGKETAEEKKFIDQENKLHRIEMTREVWEDAAGSRMMTKGEKASATPGLARKATDIDSATPGARRKGIKVKASSSVQVAERLNSIRLRIAFARARAIERGASLGI
jgi:hypothetical protein